MELQQALKNVSKKFIPILAISDSINDYIAIDLSINNTKLAKQLHTNSTSQDWEKFMEDYLKSSGKKSLLVVI